MQVAGGKIYWDGEGSTSSDMVNLVSALSETDRKAAKELYFGNNKITDLEFIGRFPNATN
jgi:hypothetical protein